MLLALYDSFEVLHVRAKTITDDYRSDPAVRRRIKCKAVREGGTELVSMKSGAAGRSDESPLQHLCLFHCWLTGVSVCMDRSVRL